MAVQLNLEVGTEIPLDILENIANVLGDEIHWSLPWYERDCYESRTALKMLSLACKIMVLPCRRHLFAKIGIEYPDRIWLREHNLQWRIGRNKFFLSQPIIAAHYLKSLTVDTRLEFDTSDYDLLKMICETSYLTSVTISSDNNWRGIPENKRATILSLMQKPLNKLCIHGNFSTYYFGIHVLMKSSHSIYTPM